MTKNLFLFEILETFSTQFDENFYTRKQTSHFFGKNFVKATFLLKSWFDEIFFCLLGGSKYFVFPHCNAIKPIFCDLMTFLSCTVRLTLKVLSRFHEIFCNWKSILSFHKLMSNLLRIKRWSSEITWTKISFLYSTKSILT